MTVRKFKWFRRTEAPPNYGWQDESGNPAVPSIREFDPDCVWWHADGQWFTKGTNEFGQTVIEPVPESEIEELNKSLVDVKNSNP
jgi:hypothetical protein